MIMAWEGIKPQTPACGQGEHLVDVFYILQMQGTQFPVPSFLDLGIRSR